MTSWISPSPRPTIKLTGSGLSCFAAFVALLWAVYQMRVHQLQEQEKQFREAVETMPALAFVADSEGQSDFYEQGLAPIHRIEPEKKRQRQDGRRRFILMISTASPSDGTSPRRLANLWIMKPGCAADRTESIAGS